MRGKCLMLQGTASSAGKSTLAAALLRIMAQDGLRAVPFKAQNMALNSFATREGLEMGRAQVLQAQAAFVEPSVNMNPVLLKPTGDRSSQVIVRGRPVGVMSAMEYERYKPALRETIRETYEQLERDADVVVIEGAGSPAEINLKAGDIVNMAMAKTADAPVLLVGDINPGGVFAALYGTVKLLDEEEQRRIKGILINKFRGDVEILKPGLEMIEQLLGIPVLGVIPWTDLDLEDEDSVSQRLTQRAGEGKIRAAVVRLPHISNFTDFALLDKEKDVSLAYTARPSDLREADVILLPGTKNTIEDLIWLKEKGLAAEILRHAREGGLVIGICGGYQMLGKTVSDPLRVESAVPEEAGLGLLDFDVVFRPGKRTVQAAGTVRCASGLLKEADGLRLQGYEIHCGVTRFGAGCVPFLFLDGRDGPDGVCSPEGNVLGTYLHGLFDSGALWRVITNRLRERKGLPPETGETASLQDHREAELNRLADLVRKNLNMEDVYRIVRGEEAACGRWRG